MRIIKNKFVYCGLIILIIYLIPYLWLGKDAYVPIHDFLDSTIGHINMIVNTHHFFDTDVKLPLMDGVNRNYVAFTTPFELKAVLLYLFSPYWGIVVNLFIIKLCAFVGMYLLLNKYIIPQKELIVFLVSLLYSFIPFYVDYGISSAGIPLLLYGLLNYYNGSKPKSSLLIIFFYAIYSYFFLSGVFVCILLLLSIIIVRFKSLKWNLPLVYSFIFLSSIYIVTNLLLICNFFFTSDFVSHRSEWKFYWDFPSFISHLVSITKGDAYHAGEFQSIPILFSFLILIYVYKKEVKTLKYYLRLVLFLLLLITIGSLVYLIPIQLFTSFQFDRFYFIYPTLCFIILAITCEALINENKKLLSMGLILVVFLCAVNNNREYFKNVRRLFGYADSFTPSYSQFYDEELFGIICQDLHISQDYSVKVISVGMHPSVAEYNGFWTLDAYLVNYPLDYKHKFRKVIEKELMKNDDIKKYFDDWGNRCYAFSSEIGKIYLINKYNDFSINNLEYNFKALKSLGCNYIFSSVEIKNPLERNLKYQKSYTTQNSYYNIRVYQVI